MPAREEIILSKRGQLFATPRINSNTVILYLARASIKTEIENNNGFYFITFICYKWIRMYEELKMYDCVYKHLNNFIQQKLNYIHNHPLHPRWNFVTKAIDYKHSSARFYETGEAMDYAIPLVHGQQKRWNEQDK